LFSRPIFCVHRSSSRSSSIVTAAALTSTTFVFVSPAYFLELLQAKCPRENLWKLPTQFSVETFRDCCKIYILHAYPDAHLTVAKQCTAKVLLGAEKCYQKQKWENSYQIKTGYLIS